MVSALWWDGAKGLLNCGYSPSLHQRLLYTSRESHYWICVD